MRQVMVAMPCIHRQLETDVSVHVALGHMMDHLPDSPAAVAIRRIELFGREPLHGAAQPGWSRCDDLDITYTVRYRNQIGRFEFSYWVPGICLVNLARSVSHLTRSS